MNLLADIHGYPPFHNSGAEWMAHSIFRYLSKKHNVVILLNFNSYLGHIDKEFEIDGIKVVDNKESDRYYQWADVVFTHLDNTGRAYNYCRKYDKPLIHFIHNNYKNIVVENMYLHPQYAIYNTNWVREDRKDAQRAIRGSVVIHPPVYVEDYKTRHINHYITLINLNPNKGGKFLIELAKAMPERMFMGVWGSYGTQIHDDTVKNIHYVYNTPNIRDDVYARTRILLMPSQYESYGRTAIEAQSSGIPVICTETPGLKEALGESGIYCELDVKQWIKAIRRLDDMREYELASQQAYQNANEKDTEGEFKQLDKLLSDVSKNKKDTRQRSGGVLVS